jgi:hypothetical protein
MLPGPCSYIPAPLQRANSILSKELHNITIELIQDIVSSCICNACDKTKRSLKRIN